MPGKVRHVALAISEHLRICTLVPDERVVGRNTAVVADAQNFADVVVELLRKQRLVATVATVVLDVVVHRQIDHAVGAEGRAPRHRSAGNPRVRLEDLLHVEQRITIEPRTSERTSRHVTALLDVVEVHEPVRSEQRMHDDGLQRTGLDARRRPARERHRSQRAAAHDAHLPLAALNRLVTGGGCDRRLREAGDQEISVRRERHVTRALEPFGDRTRRTRNRSPGGHCPCG